MNKKNKKSGKQLQVIFVSAFISATLVMLTFFIAKHINEKFPMNFFITLILFSIMTGFMFLSEKLSKEVLNDESFMGGKFFSKFQVRTTIIIIYLLGILELFLLFT